MSGQKPQVFVVITTRDPAHSIVPALRALYGGDHDQFDIVVVDQSDSDLAQEAAGTEEQSSRNPTGAQRHAVRANTHLQAFGDAKPQGNQTAFPAN
jgi:hypothetical protein